LSDPHTSSHVTLVSESAAAAAAATTLVRGKSSTWRACQLNHLQLALATKHALERELL